MTVAWPHMALEGLESRVFLGEIEGHQAVTLGSVLLCCALLCCTHITRGQHSPVTQALIAYACLLFI